MNFPPLGTNNFHEGGSIAECCGAHYRSKINQSWLYLAKGLLFSVNPPDEALPKENETQVHTQVELKLGERTLYVVETRRK